MIVELFLIPLLFLLFAGWGCWAKSLLSIKNESITISVILGLSLYGLVACILAFFVPLNIPVEIFLLCIGAVPYLLKKIRKYLPLIPEAILKSVCFWGFALTVILAGSYYNFRPDHFWYYVPSLRWLNEYGLITGIANVDWVLGQMSFMHIIQAGIDQTIDPFGRFGIFIVILFLIYIFERKSFLLLLFVPFYFLYFQTPSPDLPVVFFSLIVVNEFCFHYQENHFKTLFTISVFVFVIKPVAFWLPLWIFIAVLCRNKNELKSIRTYVLPSLLLFSFFIKNMIIASCLIYPATFTQISTYWLPDAQILEISDQISALCTFDYHYDLDTIHSFSYFEKLYRWLTLPDLQTIINLAIIIILLFFGVISFFRKKMLYIILFFIAVFKLWITFFFSGQFRFMLDVVYPILFILLLSLNIKRQALLSGSLLLFVISLLYVSFPTVSKEIIPSFKLPYRMVGFTPNALVHPENYEQGACQRERVGNLDFNIPIHDFYNYETPTPAIRYTILCRYYSMGIFPQWKDPACIHKGFYVKKLSAGEKDTLGRIIRMIENLQ